MHFDSKPVSLNESRPIARYRRFLTIKAVGGACSALGAVAIQAVMYVVRHHL